MVKPNPSRLQRRKMQARQRELAVNDTRSHDSSEGGSSAADSAAKQDSLRTVPAALLVVAAVAATAAFFWSYWTRLADLAHTWEVEPDYSHGYLVLPVALYFLWARRDRFPGTAHRHWLWPGVLLLTASLVMRYVAGAFYLDAIDGWSILLWAAGIVWLLGGFRWLLWALPSIAFLLFMIPLPFRVERWLSYPLQRVATLISSWTLQCLGLPAFAQGNTISMDEHTLEVAQACSGLTIFIGIGALAFAYAVLVRRSWWEKALLFAAVLPIALVANSARIVLTGLLYEYASDAAAQRFSHDLAGWLMLPFAALLFAAVLWYIDRLFPRVEQLDMRDMVRQHARSELPAESAV